MNKLVIGNLKMNLLSPLERERYLSVLKKEISGKRLKRTEIVICPPYIHIEHFKKNVGKKIKLGAQNMFWQRGGSFTGEISPAMLKNFGCEYVIIGHSERRKYFCENSEEINLKVNAAHKNGLKTIICIGETRVEKEKRETYRVVVRQLKESLYKVNRTKAECIVIVYEPIWSVGTDTVPTSHEIMEVKVLIRKILVEIYGKNYANLIKIIYGGSVNAKTVRDVCIDPGMDGVLVGRESLIPYEFVKIAELINNS
jgi:triosephosphate isomerase (TIM)